MDELLKTNCCQVGVGKRFIEDESGSKNQEGFFTQIALQSSPPSCSHLKKQTGNLVDDRVPSTWTYYNMSHDF